MAQASHKAIKAVTKVGQDQLGRTFGKTGLQHWVQDWMRDYHDALDNNMSVADAEAAATAKVESNVALSSEAKGYADHGIVKTAIEGTAEYDTIDETADWFETSFTEDDANEYTQGRDTDWASKLSTSNLENYAADLNKQYGQLQGNVVGQEGLEWFGYQKTMAIDHYMSDAGGNYSFETASKIADQKVADDIKRNTGHQNYLKFGSIGYGNALEIKTGDYDLEGNPITESKYLKLDPSTNLNPTGTKTATGYQIDEDGEFVLNEEGEKIETGETYTPYTWQYVADESAPGGYKIVPVGFDPGTGTLSTAGHDFHMNNYVRDGALPGIGTSKTFTYDPNTVSNIDVARLTSTGDDKLTIGQWAESAAGKAAIAANDYRVKNKWFIPGNNGLLNYQGGFIDHTTGDSNLGLASGEQKIIDWGGGVTTTLNGATITGLPGGGGFEELPGDKYLMMIGGGQQQGNTVVVDQKQKSTTAADKAQKLEDRQIASGQGRQGFSTTKYKPTGNIRTLGIGGV